MTSNLAQWSEATEAVKEAASILLVTHVSPDGDAIGSMLGLALALRDQGKKVETAVDGGVPEFLKFIPDAAKVHSKLRRGKWDLMIALDSGDEDRTGIVGAFGKARSPKVINLDHHATNSRFGDILLIEPTAVSAAEIVYNWLGRLNYPITEVIATALLTGMITDTMGFRTSNVTPTTLQISEALMKAGAPLSKIMFEALVSISYKRIVLWKHAFQSVDLSNGVISAVVTQTDLRAAKLDATDGGLVSLLISVREAVIAVVFKELDNGKVELSFRSVPGYDVGSVALSLGGGGHRQAAGATIPGPLAAAQERVMPLLYAAAAQGTPPIA